jgi:hypothetical protein
VVGTELYESPDRPPGEPGTVHVSDGGTGTLCGQPLNSFVRVDNRNTTFFEICEKCLAWARDLSLIE